jgi:Lon protease-like protein
LKEVENSKLYREFKVDYKKYTLDLDPVAEEVNTLSLMEKVKIFFKNNSLLLNWKEFEKLDKSQSINTLSMIAPISNEEKQKLLESQSLKDKVESLENIINFYLHDQVINSETLQ